MSSLLLCKQKSAGVEKCEILNNQSLIVPLNNKQNTYTSSRFSGIHLISNRNIIVIDLKHLHDYSYSMHKHPDNSVWFFSIKEKLLFLSLQIRLYRVTKQISENAKQFIFHFT